MQNGGGFGGEKNALGFGPVGFNLSSIGVLSMFKYGLNLKKRGKNLVGICPFHREKSPSFTINEDKGFYHCFGCGISGQTSQLNETLKDMNKIARMKFMPTTNTQKR